MTNIASALLEAAIKPLAIRMMLAWERLESGVAYNLLSQDIRADPYSKYEALRRKDPVHQIRLRKSTWILTRFEDADAVLRDNQRFGVAGRDYGYIPYISMLDQDPPEHTRIRNLVSKAFTPRSIAELEPRIRNTVDQLLDRLAGRKRFDLIHEIAYPLPVIIIAEMLGVPPEDREQFNEWSNVASLTVDPLLKPEQITQVRQTVEELFDYFEGMVAARRERPQNDLISALVAAEEEGQYLSREDLLINLTLILVAGNETTRNLIGNGTLALLHSPEQLQRLRDEPDLLDSAIDELLRYDSPVQLDSRIAREPVKIGTKEIPRGGAVLCALGSANRDPEAFPNPDVLDIGRTERNHLAFGRGIHYCLGSPLARLEGRIAFESLLSRYRSIHLVEEPRYRDQIVLRGLEELWIEVA